MNYNTDKPIDTEKQDLLGRKNFSKQLAKAVYEYNAKDGLVIGLFGKWGTGKTSVINMARNEIDKLANEDENKPLIMKFSPWNYSDKDNLISVFFQSLKKHIEVNGDEKNKKKIGKALSNYAEIFDVLSYVPTFGYVVAKILKTIAHVKADNLMKVPDLDETRAQLEKALGEANKKIIIVIDDIDRLTNLQIRDIFQLVKQVGDFSNVIYILVMDREVVCRALADVHNIDGNEYLEKIIQVSFELPELRKPKLHDILFSRLEEIIKELPNEVVLNERYWGKVFTNCISPYINTLRDINRLLNTFQFRYTMLYQETSFEDLLGITTLEVLEPQLYKWIYNNKEAVCGGWMHGFNSAGDDKPDYRKLYHDEFVSMGINPNVAISCISTMFPVFAKDVNEYLYDYHSMPDVREYMRIAHEERFELYFIFDLDDIKVPRNTINSCIFNFNEAQLYEVINEINKKGDIIYFIEEIQSLVHKIPYERLSLIASVILNLYGGFEEKSSRSMFAKSVYNAAGYFIEDIIKTFKTEEETYEFIQSAVEKVDKTRLAAIACIINDIKNSYRESEEDSKDIVERIISLEHLEEIEKNYVEKIRSITASECILDINRFRHVFYLWERLDKEGVENYLSKLFESEVNKLKFTCSMATGWLSNGESGWKFESEEYEKYISRDEVYNIIQNFDKSRLNEFTEIEQIKLASFVGNYERAPIDHINEKEAQEIVKKWKEEMIE